jgi:hypothetical protein
MILSLFLAFYCVDSHKVNILSTLNRDKQIAEPISMKTEENITIKSDEIYVEVLAVEDTNESSKRDKVENKSTKIDQKVAVEQENIEKKEPEIKVEPIKDESKVIKELSSKSLEVKEVRKSVDEKVISEYSEGYKLDELEKMIRDELNKGMED